MACAFDTNGLVRKLHQHLCATEGVGPEEEEENSEEEWQLAECEGQELESEELCKALADMAARDDKLDLDWVPQRWQRKRGEQLTFVHVGMRNS